jgi:hypothetical protein
MIRRTLLVAILGAAAALVAAGTVRPAIAAADPTWVMAAPTSVEAGGTLTVAAFTPCPESPPAVGVHVAVLDRDAGSQNIAYGDVPPGDGGYWTAVLDIPAEVPPGHHLYVEAWCNAVDSGAGQVTATYAGVVVPVAGEPRAVPDPVDDSLTARQDAVLAIPATRLLANDPSGGSICQLAPPAHGHVVPGGGSGEWTYTPARGYHGADAFTYRLCDLVDGHDVASQRAAAVRITVVPPPDPRPAPANGAASGGSPSSGDPRSGRAGDPGPGIPNLGDPGTGSSTPGGSTTTTFPVLPSLAAAAAPRHHHDDSWGIVILGVAAALVCAVAAWGTWYWRRTRDEVRHVLR